MRNSVWAAFIASGSLLLSGCRHAPAPESKPMTSEKPAVDIYALSVKTLEAQPAPLSQYRGQVSLVVNVASACGYTPQYAGLERVYTKYKPKGFAVLGFPSNDFGRQEPGSPEQIREFCVSKYRVDFPMFEKVQTKAGPEQAQIYASLEQAVGSLPSWNFGKYLVSRSGKVLKFFPSKVDPEDEELTQAIESALAEGA
jgi:glutathione peroxidase